MNRRRSNSRKAPLRVESLEARALMAGGSLIRPANLAPAILQRAVARPAAIKTDPVAVSVIMSAIKGGPGSEWTNLIRRQVPNYLSVISKFSSGRLAQYSTPGVSVQLAGFQSRYTGPKYDQLSLIVAGVGLMKGNWIELGTISRGPFHDPDTSYYVFAINRGQGAKLGPKFGSLPRITPDALVTIQVGPYGSSVSGTVRDLVTGATSTIDPSQIQIQGPTLRVFLNGRMLPTNTRGVPMARYTFTAWAQTQPGNDITTVASFLPATSMNRVGVLSK